MYRNYLEEAEEEVKNDFSLNNNNNNFVNNNNNNKA